MAVMQSRDTRTFIAGVDLLDSDDAQFKFVTLDPIEGTVSPGVVGETCIGVLLVGGKEGDPVTVAISGSILMRAGEPMSAGIPVSSANGGEAIVAEDTYVIMGYARSEASAAGEIIEVEVFQGGNVSDYTPPPADSQLSDLTTSFVNGITNFQSGTTDYTIQALYSEASGTFTPFSGRYGAVIEVGGLPVLDGRESQEIYYDTGSTVTTVKVAALSGGSTTYNMTVSRATASDVSTLFSFITVGLEDDRNPAFVAGAGSTDYTQSAPANVRAFTLNLTPTSPYAEVRVDNIIAPPGQPVNHEIGVGDTTFVIVVTAENGSDTDTYNFTVTGS